MGKLTVSQLMSGIAMHVNGNTTQPATDSEEYNLFIEALNQAQNDVASVDYDWKGLRQVYKTTVSTSGTSVALPSDFVKPMGFPTVNGKEYIEIGEEETGKFLSSDKYVTFNLANKYMTINPALVTVSSVNIPYLSYPSTLATVSQVSFVPSDQYLIKKASGYILLSRENPKYTEYFQEAEVLLSQMIGKEVHDFIQKNTTVKNIIRDRSDFKMGVSG